MSVFSSYPSPGNQGIIEQKSVGIIGLNPGLIESHNLKVVTVGAGEMVSG